MLEANDILFIVIAFCVLWVSAFFCWFVYQLVIVLKSLNDVLNRVREHVEYLEKAVNGFKVKMEKGSSHLHNISQSIKKVVDKGKK